MVATRLHVVKSSSSKVRMKRLLWVIAHCTYAARCGCSQLSPCCMVPSCMSLFRLGITKEKVGRGCSRGKLVKGRLVVVGTLVKLTHGACLRAYAPDVQTGEPGGQVFGVADEGESGVEQVRPRLAVLKEWGQVSLVTP